MTHWKQNQPRKKRRANIKRESPFPVPIATLTGEPASSRNWYYYTGQLQGNHVLVQHSGDIYFLYSMVTKCVRTLAWWCSLSSMPILREFLFII